MMDKNPPVLAIDNLSVAYRFDKAWLNAVRDFSLKIEPGQTYGLVGESGSGKSTIALAIMQFLSKNGRVDEGSIIFNDQNLLSLSTSEMRRIWGNQISMVPQDPLSSLNPSIRVGEQIAEILRQHMDLSNKEARERAVDLLRDVRVPDPARVAQSYPHQISGGMQQRVLIAMALSTEPKLLILDEPTTGLDVTTQAAILDLFRDLIIGRQTAALYVTHNLGVVASICQRVAVLYAGELVEDAPVVNLFNQPWHPYTEGLLQSVPRLGEEAQQIELQAIPGSIPSLQNRPSACVFSPRCTLAIDRCFEERPSLETVSDGRRVRCLRWSEMAAGEISFQGVQESSHPAKMKKMLHNMDTAPLIKVQDLQVHFDGPRSLTDVIKSRSGEIIKAVDGVTFDLKRGEILGIVGESGSGKTTLARSIVGLATRTDGDIEVLGYELAGDLRSRSLETRRMLQFVFQNPDEALNPYLTIGQSLSRPMVTLMGKSQKEANATVPQLLEAVRLPEDYISRYPTQLSGGEKQRVAIARAFASSPDLLITDEPVSSLDVSVQASILNLLRELQSEQTNALIFISHDLAVVGNIADLIAVMYLGKIMEIALSKDIFKPPFHPYTEALLSAIPTLDPENVKDHIRLQGDVPSQSNLPSGCPFHPRCPRYLGEICESKIPPWREKEDGTRIFCHIPLDELESSQVELISNEFYLDSKEI